MWLINSIFLGFTDQVSLSQLIYFRSMFALCCTIKFLTETLRGYFHYFDEGTYLNVRYAYSESHFSFITPKLYKTLYILKIVSAFSLFIGYHAELALIFLAASFFIEIQVYFKFHTNLFLLFTLVLLIGPLMSMSPNDLDSFFTSAPFSQHFVQQKVSTFTSALIVTTMSIVYTVTAYKKLNPVFLSGAVVYVTLIHLMDNLKTRKYFDGFFPSIVKEKLIFDSEKKLKSRWSPLMYLTVMIEFGLGILLLSDRYHWMGVLLGVTIHLCFTLLAPATLLHFSLLSISTYPLFLVK